MFFLLTLKKFPKKKIERFYCLLCKVSLTLLLWSINWNMKVDMVWYGYAVCWFHNFLQIKTSLSRERSKISCYNFEKFLCITQMLLASNLKLHESLKDPTGNPFLGNAPYYTLWKHQTSVPIFHPHTRILGFLAFSGGIKWKHWWEIGSSYNKKD